MTYTSVLCVAGLICAVATPSLALNPQPEPPGYYRFHAAPRARTFALVRAVQPPVRAAAFHRLPGRVLLNPQPLPP